MDVVKLYLDNCCFGRPGDEPKTLSIVLEADAISAILRLPRSKCIIFGSRALDKEIAANPKEKQRAESQARYNAAVSARAVYVGSVFKKYGPIAKAAGIRKYDAYHLCYAIAAGVDYLLTTDGKFLNKAVKLTLPIKVINPLNFDIGGVS